MPFFSVIIPLYNKEGTVIDSIRSVFEQTFQDFEIIIVDDGSTDTSVKQVQSINDSRIKLFSQPNAGPSSARNHGIREASGEWVVFLDADDQLTKIALESFHEASVKASFCSCIYGNAYLLRNGTKTLCSKRHKEGFLKNPFKEAFFRRILIRAGTAAIKRSVLDSIHYNESYRRAEDSEFAFRIRKHCNCYRIDTPTVTHYSDYSKASMPLNNREEDFMFHIDMTGASFWERMCLYELYLGAKNTYKVTGKELFRDYDKRYLLLALNRLLLKKW